MKKNTNIATIILISVGVFLILGTYFLYPLIYQNKFVKKQVLEEEKIETDADRDFFMNMEEACEYGLIDHVVSRRPTEDDNSDK